MHPPIVHWRSDGTPTSPRFGERYRSAGADGQGALAQARKVFLQGCGILPDTPGAAADWAGAPVWQVLENGFGLGLNFLATWQAWRADAARPARLFYTATEAFPPEPEDLRRSAAPFPDLVPLADELIAHWRGLLPGLHRIELAGGALQLTLAVGDAAALLPELTGRFDSVFLDGFEPQKNPAMWTAELLRGIARLARPGARVATWCVAKALSERLAGCGFEIERAPGPAPQREGLRARYAPRHTPRRRRQRGDVVPVTQAARCAIVGAGLAGASLGNSLARRGWQVTVLGRGDAPADGASQLPAGLFAPHVSPDDRPLSRLTRAGCAATLARAQALLREGTDYAVTGVLERHAPGERRRPAAWDDPDTTNSIAAHATSTSAGAAIRSKTGLPDDDAHPALWHASAGWVRPAAFVGALLAAPGLRFVGGAQVARIAPQGSVWQVLDAAGQPLAEAELVVLAAGFDTLALLQASFAPASTDSLAVPAWPMHALRGQVAFGPVPADAAGLPPWPVNGHGSLIAPVPTPDGTIWVTGSTFERGNAQPEVQAADHADNLERLAELLPEAAVKLAPQWPDGRAQAWAGVRCTVPDRLPMLGPLGVGGGSTGADLGSNVPPALEPLRSKAINIEATQTPHAAPLPPWVLTGLGARGLTLAVLAGEIGAAWLHDEPLPVARSLARALHAGRFDTQRPAPTPRKPPA